MLYTFPRGSAAAEVVGTKDSGKEIDAVNGDDADEEVGGRRTNKYYYDELTDKGMTPFRMHLIISCTSVIVQATNEVLTCNDNV